MLLYCVADTESNPVFILCVHGNSVKDCSMTFTPVHIDSHLTEEQNWIMLLIQTHENETWVRLEDRWNEDKHLKDYTIYFACFSPFVTNCTL